MAKKINPTSLKNKAVCVVFSWMKSWGIDVRLPQSPEEGDLVVDGRRVVFVEDRLPGDFDFALSPSAILGSDLQPTLAELHRLTQFLGRGAPEGFRQDTGIKRAHPDDYLGVSMRLTPFGRTPNLPTSEFAKWEKVLKREADRAARRCRSLLYSMGLDRDDLKSIGLVYLSNYLHRHQTLDNDQVNGANLTLSLMQQYGRWADVTIRHLKDVSPTTVGVPINFILGSPCPNSYIDDIYGSNFEASYTFDLENKSPPIEEEPDFNTPEEAARWHHKRAIQEGRYQAKRRKNATAALESGLSELPHDRMVYILNEVAESHFQDTDARDEARRRLRDHQTNCVICLPVS
jgi:hypothetical protein